MLDRENLKNTLIKRLQVIDSQKSRKAAEVLENALVGDHWGHGDDGVVLGLADSPTPFFTLAVHEAGHRVLGVRGTGLDDENQVHRFSREICIGAGLGYDHEIEMSCRTFTRLINELGSLGSIDEMLMDQIRLAIPKEHWHILSIGPQVDKNRTSLLGF